MHKKEFIGEKAIDQQKRVLILGESHHWSANDKCMTEEERFEKAQEYSTTKVVNDYLTNYNTCSGKERDQCYRFFDNIVNAFGINPETNREKFWEKVYFGNYIDELCGVGDSFAMQLLKMHGNREKYNEQLFSFIRNNDIDIVFCFSRRVYSKLPPLEGTDIELSGGKGDLQRMDKCIYYPGERKQSCISLDKPVTVYGFHHPSRGFKYCECRNKIAAVIEEEGLFLEK